jgi:hypothetical protein
VAGRHRQQRDHECHGAQHVPHHRHAVEQRQQAHAKGVEQAVHHQGAAIDAQQLRLGGHPRTLACAPRREGGGEAQAHWRQCLAARASDRKRRAPGSRGSCSCSSLLAPPVPSWMIVARKEAMVKSMPAVTATWPSKLNQPGIDSLGGGALSGGGGHMSWELHRFCCPLKQAPA